MIHDANRDADVHGEAGPGMELGVLLARDAAQARCAFFKRAALTSAEDVNVMVMHGRGIVSALLRPARADALDLPFLPLSKVDTMRPMALCNVEAAACSETGISAAERALTLRTLGESATSPADLATPGHIRPLLVPTFLEPSRHPEARAFAAIGTEEVIAWCDILDDRGDLADWDHGRSLAATLGLTCIEAD